MRRREFIALLASATWPVGAGAQPSARPVIGFLSGRSPSGTEAHRAEFQKGLAEAGYLDGKNVSIEYRWAEGHYDRLQALAAELVARHISVIAATGGNLAGLAAKTATATIPIVFVAGGDPVKLGLVASFSRPGGNLTGVSLYIVELGAKRLELLRELIPNATSVAILANPNYSTALAEARDLQALAVSPNLKVDLFNAVSEKDLEPAFAAISAQKFAAVLVANDPVFVDLRDTLVRTAARYAVPTLYISRDFVEAGGLISYGADIKDGYRKAGIYTGQILNGAKPAELPVLQPSKFELVVNLQTAKVLGLTLPPTLLARTDEVIE